MRFKPVGKLNN
jgi:hypothetical protein